MEMHCRKDMLNVVRGLWYVCMLPTCIYISSWYGCLRWDRGICTYVCNTLERVYKRLSVWKEDVLHGGTRSTASRRKRHKGSRVYRPMVCFISQRRLAGSLLLFLLYTAGKLFSLRFAFKRSYVSQWKVDNSEPPPKRASRGSVL